MESNKDAEYRMRMSQLNRNGAQGRMNKEDINPMNQKHKIKPPTKKRNNKNILTIIFVIVIIGVVVLTVLHFKGKFSKTDELKTDSSIKSTNEASTEEQTQTEAQTKKSSVSAFVEPKIINVDADKWYLTCVNREYGIKSTYKPKLVSLTISPKDPRPNKKAKSQTMDYRVAPHYQEMYNDAAKEGIYLTPYSGYRSVEFQRQIFENFTKINKDKGYSLDEAKFKASESVLPPGTSEHNLGLAIDIVGTKTSFENSKEYKWLDTHAQDYGFILRYMKNKTNITKITYEPWHWRYVGVDDAKKIKQQGVCLEEYLKIK